MATEPSSAPTEIAVVGSINLDLVVGVDAIPLVGETVLGGDLAQIPGGKGANQAVAAARLDRQVTMIGRVGDDANATVLIHSLQTAGVDTDRVSATDHTPSGVALIGVERSGDNAIIVSAGANAHLHANDVEAAAQILADATVTLLQLEVPLDAVEAAARLAGGTVILNPAPAPAEPLPASLLRNVDVLVPNQTELATLTGFDQAITPDNAAQVAQQLDVESVVVTLGEHGALVVQGPQVTHVPAPVITPVDTTAAGDSFCGALGDALVRGEDLIDAARWAVRVGTATTLRAGAQPSLPTRDDVTTLGLGT